MIQGVSQQRREELWQRAERMRIGVETIRASREALEYMRAAAARVLPADAGAWFDPSEFLSLVRTGA